MIYLYSNNLKNNIITIFNNIMNLSNIERAHMNKPKLMMGGSY